MYIVLPDTNSFSQFYQMCFITLQNPFKLFISFLFHTVCGSIIIRIFSAFKIVWIKETQI